MAQVLQTGTVGVTGNVTATAPSIPIGATLITKDFQSAASGTADLYTVTAGKTLYILSAWVACCNANAASNYQECALQADFQGTGVYTKFVGCASGYAAAQGAGDSNSVVFNVPIPVPATKKVQAYKNGGTTTFDFTGGFIGYEA